jgi:tetratricopeptide (TPR) repeat protein
MMRATSLALCAALVAVPLGAQQQPTPGATPPRPALPAGADTNDAQVYLEVGRTLLRKAPAEAAKAFYWATRISPGMAEGYYGRRVALLMSDPARLVLYMEGDKKVVESAEMRRIDSLYLRALTLNPLLYRRLDDILLRKYLEEAVMRSVRRTVSAAEEPSATEVSFWIESWLRSADPSIRAWLAYSEGRYDEALKLYATAIRQTKEKSDVHADRARTFLLAGRADSAVAEFGRAIAEARKRDRKETVAVYESKAVLEHSTGVVLEAMGRDSAAREAYGRAITEDLSYHPAHAYMALLALRTGDTATAVSELALAVQIKGDDPGLRFVNGTTLAAVGQGTAAVTELEKAIELEPYFAAPYEFLGRIYHAAGFDDDAVRYYKEFLTRASQRDPMRASVQERITKLTPAKPTTPDR